MWPSFGYFSTGYLTAKDEFCSGEDIDLDFGWYFGSYMFMREGHLCLIHHCALSTG
jgi:hypothetical protein